VSQIERGVQNISLGNIGKIARALRVKLVDIFRVVR
jgi:transcriptional regulator with XRE-family HTH domain